MNEIQKTKREIRRFWQYHEDRKMLKILLEDIKKLRKRIKKFEEKNGK